MASIVVRGLDDDVKSQLQAQAQKNGRSMEAEAREILTSAVSRPHLGLALLAAGRASGGVDDLPVPPREDVARSVDL